MVGMAHCSSLSSRKYERPSGHRPRISAQSWIGCSHRGTRRWRILVVDGKGWSSVGHPSVSVVMGILDVMEVDIWLPAKIVVSPIGWRFAVSSVATFLPMTDGQVACPLWMWKARSSGQCRNFPVACVMEARAVTPSAPSSFRILV